MYKENGIKKNTRREYRCDKCLDDIPINSCIIKDPINKWVNNKVFCNKCALIKIKENIKLQKESIKFLNLEKTNNSQSAYVMFKENIEYYENIITYIKNTIKQGV